MTPLTEDDIVERIYRAHSNQPTPQLRPVLRRIWAAGLSIVEADALNAADPGPCRSMEDGTPLTCEYVQGHKGPHSFDDAADPGPDMAPERT